MISNCVSVVKTSKDACDEACFEGYYPSGSGNSITCYKDIDNCSSFNSSGYCTSCDAGYYRNSSSNATACKLKNWNCNSLNQSLSDPCLVCIEGYYINSSDDCSRNAPYCDTIDGSYNCSEC